MTFSYVKPLPVGKAGSVWWSVWRRWWTTRAFVSRVETYRKPLCMRCFSKQRIASPEVDWAVRELAAGYPLAGGAHGADLKELQ